MLLETAAIIALATQKRVTLATAESLTGGMVCASLVSVPGASEVVRGGIVAYNTAIKVSVLGVSQALIEREGPVAHSVAVAMARGAQKLFGSDLVVSTTGVAGPEPHGGHGPGTVVIAVVGQGLEHVTSIFIEGDRDAVMRGAVLGALTHLEHALDSLVSQ